MTSIVDANSTEDRRGKLIALAEVIAEQIDKVKYAKDLAPLAKQYRETIREIEEIEGVGGNNDEIADILHAREVDGKSRTVRKDKTKIS